MDSLRAFFIGLLEGITEFLPISSTGHLVLFKRAAGLQGAGVDSFLVVVQLGALLAALLYYRRRLFALLNGCLRREKESLSFVARLAVASMPLLVLAYVCGGWIKRHLFSETTVALALIVGGVGLLVLDLCLPTRQAEEKIVQLDRLSWGRTLVVGLFQMLALFPGMSRSMATIVGGRVVGLSRVDAADFAFLLAIPTLGSATLYELLHGRREIFSQISLGPFLIGLGAAFLAGALVIRVFLNHLRRFGLWPFAVYRIVLGGIVLLLRFL